MNLYKRLIACAITIAMVITCCSSVFAVSGQGGMADVGDAVPGVSGEGNVIDPNAEVMILVNVNGAPALQQTKSVKNAADLARGMLKKLPAQIERVETVIGESIEVEGTYALLLNGFSFVGKYWMLDEINKLDGVTAVIPEQYEILGEVNEPGTVTPSMGNSTVTTGAQQAWELGYDGEGAVIAILDTGIRSTHEAFSVMPESGRFSVDYLTGIVEEYGDLVHFGLDAEQLYTSAKLPFSWDYFDNDYIPNHTASDHGTHVAGIAAGNNGVDFFGVAKNAQIVTMQVFENTGSAYFTTLVKAMEDCVYLGVDAINMSLGSPAGFSNASTGSPGMAEVLEALNEAGVSVNVAAGNDGNTLTWTNYGNYYTTTYQGLASNPDTGLVGSPSTYVDSFAVASVVNASANTGYLVINGRDFFYGVVAGVPAFGEIPGEYRVVNAGLGYPEDLEAAGAEGAIALVQRGTLTFAQKCQNAADAGAVGILIYNNVPGGFNPSVTSTIPLGILTLEQGQAIAAQMVDGVANGTIVPGLAYGAIAMARSSSWGTTADLLIKPEISAPGDGVTSAIGFDGDSSYASWSGTSMATPHIAAAMAMIKQRVRELYPNATNAEVTDIAYCLAMSTAHQVSGFVRQQGAGFIDIPSALTSEVYLTVGVNGRPKLELGDSENGTFNFSFNVVNAGNTERTYTIIPSVMTEIVSDYEYSGVWTHPETPSMVKLINGTTYDVTDMTNIIVPETVTVAANSSTTVEMAISASDELMAYFAENCASGMYLEGFIKLVEVAEDGIDLSIPFLGFVGDWDYPSMLDRGYYYQAATGEINYQQLLTCSYNYAGYSSKQGMGVNWYADMTGQTYLADRNAISPNGDGMFDGLTYVELALLRNPKTFRIIVEDLDGNLLETLYNAEYSLKKDYYISGLNGGDSYKSFYLDFFGEGMEENETVNVVIESLLDHEGYLPENNESGRWIIPVTKDTQAPTVLLSSDGFNVVDENYVAYYAVYTDAALTNMVYETGVFADARGVASSYDFTEDGGVYYVAVADYAGNESVYEIDRTTGVVTDLESNFFDNGRTIVAYAYENYAANQNENGWISFPSGNPEGDVTVHTLDLITPISGNMFGGDVDIVGTATAPDGTVYAASLTGLSTIDPETFDRENIWTSPNYNVDGYTAGLRNIAIDPETGDIWCLYYSYNAPDAPNGKNIGILDLDGGKIVYKFACNNAWAMTLIEPGVLAYYDGNRSIYTVDYAGAVLTQYNVPCYDPQYGASHIGIKGATGSMLYDNTQNCVYVSSAWSWFGVNRYATGGMFKYDFDTQSFTMQHIGNGAGRVIFGMYFADQAGTTEEIELIDYVLDKEELNIYLNGSGTIDFLRNPVDANQYELIWESEDESIATVSGNKRRATVVGNSVGITTITCTVMVDGAVFGTAGVTVSVAADPALNAALNAAGNNLIFGTTNPYPFVPVEDGDRYYVQSSNQGISNSMSSVSTTLHMDAGETLSFDYIVSSEIDYDFFNFIANGVTVLADSGTSVTDWTTYVYTAETEGVYTFEWQFVKDPAVEEGSDSAKLDNVAYSGAGVYELGDVNGDGVIDSADVMLILRYSLSLVDLSAGQIDAADVNGDGNITPHDALILMREVLLG